MKRWWNPPQPRPARATGRRVHRVLAPAMMAGAICLAVQHFPIPPVQPTLPRTSGAVVAAWAFGTLSETQQPNSDRACDMSHICELAISSEGGAGTGTGATIKNDPTTSTQADPGPNLPFTLTEIIDYQHSPIKARGNADQGTCYPASGVRREMAAVVCPRRRRPISQPIDLPTAALW